MIGVNAHIARFIYCIVSYEARVFLYHLLLMYYENVNCLQ